MVRLSKGIFSIVLLSLFLFSSVEAQSIPGIQEPITVQARPQFPKPNTTVTVTAQSFSTDLDRAGFTWMVNGTVFKKGTGIKEISVPSGKAGVLTTVSVSIDTTDIGAIMNDVSWRPAGVTLLWQSDGYTPPFYRGKALESYGASFKVVAIPEFLNSNGKRVDPKTLIYTWKKNGATDGASSGYGRDSFKTSQESFVRGGDDISVEVSDSDRTIGAVGTITLFPTIPEIVLYENSPLYGIIYEKALGESLSLISEEITLRVEPFNISLINSSLGALSFDWTINEVSAISFQNRNEITLRKSGSGGGESIIGVLIQHKDKILQGGQTSITIFQ